MISPDDKKKVADAIREMSDSMLRIDAEKELMKDIVEVTNEKYEVDKKAFRKLATIYHKQNMEEQRTQSSEVFELYEELFK
jgi:predicted polyphosphate/ATP-dependent NAD kinase